MKLYLKVVEVDIEHDEKFLIIKMPEGKHAGGLLSFPAGKVEEIDEQNEWDILKLATKREIQEEVGLDLKNELKYIISDYCEYIFFSDKGGLDRMQCFEHLQPVFLPNGAIERAYYSYNARKIL